MHVRLSFNNPVVLLAAASVIFMTSSSSAQSYCTPTFGYGCFSWRNTTVHLDSINWTVDPYDCETYDYTSYGTTLTVGTIYQMKVSNGNWCGCGVWIDLNHDGAFDSTENFFHSYIALELNSYSFEITIPSDVATGTYRMRVVAGWGSDCFSPGSNGYGACGNYQYGNFDDFTIHVQGTATGVQNTAGDDHIPLMEIHPNPVADVAVVSINDFQFRSATIQLMDAAGKIIQSINPGNQQIKIAIGELPKGIYFLCYRNGSRNETIKVVK